MLKWISALLVLGLAVGWMWSRTEDGSGGIAAPGAGPDRPEVDIDEPLLEGESAPGESTERTGVTPVIPDAAGAATPLVIHIQVVLELGGSPVPGATVFFLDHAADGGWRGVWENKAERADYFTTRGRRLESDAQGRLSVPATKDGALLGVALGLQGETEWSGYPAGVVELKLAMHADLEVDVVDAEGFHVPHVPVTLCVDRPGSPTYLVIRKTAAGAPARFTNVRRLLRDRGPPEGYAVMLAFPATERERVSLARGELPSAPIILTMPECGSVHVDVTGPGGSRLDAGTLVSLAIRSDVEDSNYRAEISERLSKGSVDFPFIGVGTQLTLRVHGVGELRPTLSSHDGPASQGDRVVIAIEMTSSFPALVGRLVDRHGAPLGERSGRMSLTSAGNPVAQTILDSDADGRFRAVFRETWQAADALLAHVELNAVPGTPPLDTLLDVAHAMPEGETVLGDVVLTVQPAVASGRVVDAEGAGLIAANVRVEVQREDSEEWYSPRGLVAPSLADGSFAIYGRTDAPAVRIAVRRSGFITSTLGPLPAGTEGIEVVLKAGQDTAPKPDGLRSGGR